VDRPPDAASLYAELLRLTEEMHGAARDGDATALGDLFERRDVVVSAIGGAPVAAESAAALSGIVERVLTLDRELLAALSARRDSTREALEAVIARRRSLQSYRGAPPSGPLFVERLG
jgi:hypothetical protein